MGPSERRRQGRQQDHAEYETDLPTHTAESRGFGRGETSRIVVLHVKNRLPRTYEIDLYLVY